MDMVVKLKGSFTRHSHPHTDDFFLVTAAPRTVI